MTTLISFNENLIEKTFPIIKITRSKNKKTGTAIFIFPYSNSICLSEKIQTPINYLYLKGDNILLFTKKINVFFRNGKPFFLRAIFIFKNTQEWLDFFQFMRNFAQENQLIFSKEF